LAYPGPHSLLIPYADDRFFVDMAWLLRRLYDLFWGVHIPDQNFKGEALEAITRSIGATYPINVCRKGGRARKQIDAAFAVGPRLVAIECRAKSRAIALDRGDPNAIRQRCRFIVDQSLRDIDEKCSWLAANPVGDNYDIRRFTKLVPVAVSPFVEFVPSPRSHYWLSPHVPRVLTPTELREYLSDGLFERGCWNEIAVRR